MVLLRAAAAHAARLGAVQAEPGRPSAGPAATSSGAGACGWASDPRLVLEPGEVDPAEIGQQVAGRVVLGERDLLVVLIEDLGVQPEAPELLDEDLERLRDARRLDLLALHDGLVRLDATEDVVGLDGKELLQDVRGAVRLERPDLHLAEPLATELGLATERLLGDQAVRAGRPGVDLVLDKMVELEHVDVADGDLPVERLAGATVAELDLAVVRQAGSRERLADLLLRRPVEDGGRGLEAHLVEGPAEMCLEDLADVHPARHAERVKNEDRKSTRLNSSHPSISYAVFCL